MYGTSTVWLLGILTFCQNTIVVPVYTCTVPVSVLINVWYVRVLLVSYLYGKGITVIWPTGTGTDIQIPVPVLEYGVYLLVMPNLTCTGCSILVQYKYRRTVQVQVPYVYLAR